MFSRLVLARGAGSQSQHAVLAQLTRHLPGPLILFQDGFWLIPPSWFPPAPPPCRRVASHLPSIPTPPLGACTTPTARGPQQSQDTRGPHDPSTFGTHRPRIIYPPPSLALTIPKHSGLLKTPWHFGPPSLCPLPQLPKASLSKPSNCPHLPDIPPWSRAHAPWGPTGLFRPL